MTQRCLSISCEKSPLVTHIKTLDVEEENSFTDIKGESVGNIVEFSDENLDSKTEVSAHSKLKQEKQTNFIESIIENKIKWLGLVKSYCGMFAETVQMSQSVLDSDNLVHFTSKSCGKKSRHRERSIQL